MVNLYACAHVLKDVAAQHAAKTQAEPVIEADGRAVEHLPEPEQRFAGSEFFAIDFGEVPGLQSDVLGIERETDDVSGQLRSESEIEFAAVGTAKIELVKLVAHDFGAALGRVWRRNSSSRKRIQRR